MGRTRALEMHLQSTSIMHIHKVFSNSLIHTCTHECYFMNTVYKKDIGVPYRRPLTGPLHLGCSYAIEKDIVALKTAISGFT